MKPTKNRVFCRDCRRVKMLFDTQEKADAFILRNQEQIKEESGYSPKRSYHCIVCGGWHVTSGDTFNETDPGKADKILTAYRSLNMASQLLSRAETLLNQASKCIKTDDLDASIQALDEVKEITDALESGALVTNRGKQILYRYAEYRKKISIKKHGIDITNPIQMSRKILEDALTSFKKGCYDDCARLLSEADVQIELIEAPSKKNAVTNTYRYIATKLNLKHDLTALEAMAYPHKRALAEGVKYCLGSIDLFYWSEDYHDCVLLLQKANRIFQLLMMTDGGECEKETLKVSIDNWIKKLETAMNKITHNQRYV